ncbi:MAG: Nif3-like dinuclear metal center hexameric protein [Elusimicrobiaceae bacterium]
MADRNAIVEFLDTYLNSRNIADSSSNGLQVEGKREIKKVVFGVSASLELFKASAKAGADMVIVHHGLIWNDAQRVTGTFKNRINELLKNDMNMVAYHLPLDMHPAVGNNAVLLRDLGARDLKPFALYHGAAIGFKGRLAKPLTLGRIAEILNKKYGAQCQVAAFGPYKVKTIGAISGGGGGMAWDAVRSGLDLFITGETSEPAWEMFRENKINYIAAGHYNSEKSGVLALLRLLKTKFKVETEFIDIPNPF